MCVWKNASYIDTQGLHLYCVQCLPISEPESGGGIRLQVMVLPHGHKKGGASHGTAVHAEL